MNPKGNLTPIKILKATIKIADQEGIKSLSMRKLAKKLKVEAMSIYHHFANKDQILDGIVDLIFQEIKWDCNNPD